MLSWANIARASVIVSAWVLASTTVYAQQYDFYSVRGLTVACAGAATGSADIAADIAVAARATQCAGYVTGAAHLLGVLGTIDEYRAFGICPGTAAPAAFVQAFMNWSDAHPERWGDDALVGVVIALRDVWPCGAAAPSTGLLFRQPQ